MNDSLKEAVSHGTKEFPFACYVMENLRPGFNVPLHWHDEIEILYMKSGSLTLTINQVSYTGKPGDIFLVNPKEIHGMTTNDLRTRYHALLFPLRFSSFQSKNSGSNAFYLPFSEGRLLLRNKISDEPLHKETVHTICRILSLYQAKTTGFQLGIQIQCAQLLYTLYTGSSYQRLAPTGSEANTNREILAYLQANYPNKISLEEMADAFHMSEKYFSRYFKKHFQTTFTGYLNSLRLENAAKLLTDTDLAITEIAMQSGFNNVSYFIRTFRDAFGCSPLHYRKG